MSDKAKQNLQERARRITSARRPGEKGNKHKYGGRNNGPARQRYWQSGRLEERKVRHLMVHNGMTRSAAMALWRSVRLGRRKTY